VPSSVSPVNVLEGEQPLVFFRAQQYAVDHAHQFHMGQTHGGGSARDRSFKGTLEVAVTLNRANSREPSFGHSLVFGQRISNETCNSHSPKPFGRIGKPAFQGALYRRGPVVRWPIRPAPGELRPADHDVPLQ